MIKNQANQTISFALATPAGVAITSGTVTAYITIDGGAQVVGTGTSEAEGNGQWTYKPTQAETNGDSIGFLFIIAGGVPAHLTVLTVTLQQVAALSAATLPTAITAGDIINDAGDLIGISGRGRNLNAEEMQKGLRALNRVINDLSAAGIFISQTTEAVYSIAAAQSEYVFGTDLTGTNIDVGPMRISAAALRTSNHDYTIEIVSVDEFAEIADKTIEDITTRLYYEKRRALKLYPRPSAGHSLVLWAKFPMSNFGTVGTVSPFQAEYNTVLINQLAVYWAPSFGIDPSPATVAVALSGRENLRAQNIEVQELDVPDYGGRHYSTDNILSGA